MVVFTVKLWRIAIRNVARRNHGASQGALIVRKLYSTRHLPQSREMEQQVKTPNFNEFKGMKAEFPCITRLTILYVIFKVAGF